MKVEIIECPNCKSKKLYMMPSGLMICKKCNMAFESHEIPNVFYEEEEELFGKVLSKKIKSKLPRMKGQATGQVTEYEPLIKKKKYKSKKPWWWRRNL